jgi:hypothetical protein
MRTLLFDGRGNLADPGSVRLRRDLSAEALGEDFVDYAVRNLGYIALSHSAPVGARMSAASSVRVRIRPQTASPVAFAALMYWLGDSCATRILVSSYQDHWTHALYGDLIEAKARLIAFMRPSLADRAGDFLSRHTDPDRVDNRDPLIKLVRLAAEYDAPLSLPRIQPILDHGLQGRYTYVSAASDLKHLIIKTVGSGFAKEATYWLQRSIGTRLEDQPDQAFGAWVADAYRETMRSGRPAIDDVDVIVAWPTDGRRRYTYRRLLVPIKAPGDAFGVLCATLQDRSIDLRVEAG